MPFDTDQDEYQSLKDTIAERTRRVVVWCGAGLSVPAGLPTWSKLREMQTASLRRKAESLDDASRNQVLGRLAAIQRESNPWVAFQRLETELGVSTFRDTIRKAFQGASTSRVPEVYSKLWRMNNISGLLNLNLDRLATRAYAEVFPDRVVNLPEFDSTNVASYTRILRTNSHFIYNLHGTESNADSWVLTHDKLQRLMENEAYKHFVSVLLTDSTVIFLGLSADDIAVGSHLERLTSYGVDIGSHYWITDRNDLATDQWAERLSIRTIRYRNSDGAHHELVECVGGLISPTPPPEPSHYDPILYVSPITGNMDLPSPDDLSRLPEDEIRIALNRRAAQILKGEDQMSFAAYQQFTDEYEIPIYRAWFVSDRPGKNKLLGYTLVDRVATGSFGQVYKATDPSGSPVAVKVLLNQIRTEPELLQCFRRGVRAMRILAEHRIAGMVEYKEASEIPAFVVMDWVEGANLREAVDARRVADWRTILEVSARVSEIIHSAHLLPQRVLHRDLRPENIMLRHMWTEDTIDVVVLDFDLSWHHGAYEKSVLYGSGTGGYWAPEQIQRIKGVSTRHASVDSFGMGMLFAFMVTGKDPVPDNHLHSDWAETISRAAGRYESKTWKSIPDRFARLILNATKHSQSERWDVTQIRNEISRLSDAIIHPSTVDDSELIANELAKRSQAMYGSSWSDASQSSVLEHPTGLRIEIGGLEPSHQVRIELSQSKVGVEEWRRAGRLRAGATEAAGEALRSGGWNVDEVRGSQSGQRFVAYAKAEEALHNMDVLANAIDKAVRILRPE